MWRLGFVATVGTDGRPNVSPKGTFVVLDPETIAFGEIRSPQTITNLTANPETEINFVDQFTRKGVRVRGQAQMVPRGTAEFDGLIPHWQAGWGALADRVNIIVRIPVDQARPLVTPPYDDGATEEDMIAAWKQKCAGFYPGA
ncbi:MAG: pyridoxamine 5'-phosphate oxidase family protein [Rhodobacteraceae bacterium]|nr:pyridoxamine 5'-phosphate oxidase family protein [Paracoccaceae bacterium]